MKRCCKLFSFYLIPYFVSCLLVIPKKNKPYCIEVHFCRNLRGKGKVTHGAYFQFILLLLNPIVFRVMWIFVKLLRDWVGLFRSYFDVKFLVFVDGVKCISNSWNVRICSGESQCVQLQGDMTLNVCDGIAVETSGCIEIPDTNWIMLLLSWNAFNSPVKCRMILDQCTVVLSGFSSRSVATTSPKNDENIPMFSNSSDYIPMIGAPLFMLVKEWIFQHQPKQLSNLLDQVAFDVDLSMHDLEIMWLYRHTADLVSDAAKEKDLSTEMDEVDEPHQVFEQLRNDICISHTQLRCTKDVNAAAVVRTFAMWGMNWKLDT